MKSEKIEIRAGDARYQARVGRGLLARAGALTRQVLDPSRCAIIADENSARVFGKNVLASFTAANFSPRLLAIPPGEKSKSLSQVEKLCDEMMALSLDRTSFVVGLGGGVVGDISGFVAAIFQRGIPHVQIPTTLLAMVDSAIGGKTGVNLAAGKNLVGAIHQPALIIADLDALEKLPGREIRQGFAEIIKHAIIRDAGMFQMLASSRAPKAFGVEGSRGGSLKVTSSGSLGFARDDGLVARNIKIKAKIVAEDAKEQNGQRALLNFGHTIGHGIERATNFRIPHGDCVSLGMVAACEISIKRAGLTRAERENVVALLRKFDLPTTLPAKIDRARILEAIARDKKFVGGRVRFVVTPRIGEAFLSRDVTMADLREAVATL